MSPPDTRRDLPEWLGLAVLLAVTFAVYARSLFSGFVYDAQAQVLIDHFIHDRSHFWDVLSLRVMSMDVLDFNRPVHLLSMMLDSAVWGRNPVGYHLTSILLHCAVIAVFYAAATRLSGNRFAGFVGALIFALHPVNCEAVAEPSYREDLLVTLFGALTLLLASRTTADWKTKWGWQAALIPVCCFLAVGAKESGVALPLFFLAVAAMPATAGVDEPDPVKGSRKIFFLVLGAAALAVSLFLAARFLLEPKGSTIFTAKPPAIAKTYADIFLVQVRIWTYQLATLFWPPLLCADYGPYSLRWITVVPALVAVTLVVVVQIALGLRYRLLLVGAVLFWASILPVSNFIPIYRPMADRFLYQAMLGVALTIVALVSIPRVGRILGIALCVAALPLGIATFQREAVWHDSVALWEDTLNRNPFSATAANNLATALAEVGRALEAIPIAERAINLNKGTSAENFATFAYVLCKAGDISKAKAALARATALDAAYGDPDSLVRSLRWMQPDADVLKEIARSP